MAELRHPKDVRVWEPVVLFVAITAVIIYAVNVFNTQDWLWFTSQAVDATPARLVVRHGGEVTLIEPGHAHYLPLATAASESLSTFNNTALINIGFGEDTLDYYDQAGVLVELYYDRPLAYHAAFRTGQPTQLLVPVVGRHAGGDYFFRGDQGEWWFGAMRMANPTPLLGMLAELGYVTAVK